MRGTSDRTNRRKRTMPFYEHVFIARQDLSQAQVDALAETVSNVIGEFKGQVHKTETWGLKQLAYKIQKNRQGHYAMPSAEVSGEAIEGLERQADRKRSAKGKGE